MKIQISWQGKNYTANLKAPIPIGIPIKNGTGNPNCYHTEPVNFSPVKTGTFTGSIALGGPVNHYRISLAPHGNGTHTECYGHITNSGAVIANQVKAYFSPAQLLTIAPSAVDNDRVIDFDSLQGIELMAGIEALVVRTKPNPATRQQYNYSGKNPPYFSEAAIRQFVAHGVEHLVTDLPSVDREEDGGKLAAHKAFWQTSGNLRAGATITELAYIANEIADGLYLLELQVLPIHLDASPSNPILYSLKST